MVNAELDIFGLWAYDATFALAMAVEQVLGTTNFNFDASNVSKNGLKLIQALSGTRFKGLSGDFGFINRQLESSVFQIVNFNGNGENRIGFWTLKYGLVKRLDVAGNSVPKANLGSIIWPGDPQSIPKGWEIPNNGEKLNIAVPMKNGFNEFVKVTLDPSTNSNNFSGLCIEIFENVMNEMPYPVPYAFHPLEINENESYNNLIDQVVYGKYDAVVGDISILENRSLHVEFTLPFMESSVVIVVPTIRDDARNNGWVFLKPLSLDLWITIFCFFIFIAFAIWVLEHRINEDFRGPPLHHVGTSFWFSFSTMFLAHRERVLSSPARIVVLIWCFVVLILTQSYAASLSSLLTVQQLKPTVTDINELLRKGKNVGYQDGSFVHEIVQGLTFDQSKMKVFNSAEQLNELFTDGSIAAAIDEIPYMKLFLGKHCNKYTTLTEPTFKTGGLGFVFPQGSPLVPDVSRAILKVTESSRTREIGNALMKQSNCTDSSIPDSMNSLSFGSFWGLFLITGMTTTLALIYFAAAFLYEQRDVLLNRDTGISVWRRILEVLRNFDQRNLTSHAFRRHDLREEAHIEINRIRGVGEAPVQAPVEALVEAPPEHSNGIQVLQQNP